MIKPMEPMEFTVRSDFTLERLGIKPEDLLEMDKLELLSILFETQNCGKKTIIDILSQLQGFHYNKNIIEITRSIAFLEKEGFDVIKKNEQI